MEVKNGLSEKARNDLLLVARARRGDGKAFAGLMNRYRDTIYYLMLRMVNNPSDADDLTIEAFGKAFKGIDTYSPDFAFSTWLFKIATNNCIDFIRKKRMTPSPYDNPGEEEEEITASLQSDFPDPEEIMINDQKMKRLREVIDQLKPMYRDLIELRYFREFSYEEIAAELNIPVGTVKARLNRAKGLLYNIYLKTEKQ
ncbi:MAG: sigma-70 family RNA polymerase sigma factor [Bacteroidales bacterium]|nr:sigma-70 family RNA polymerase sigma factor [Bacteroidales bacterium]